MKHFSRRRALGAMLTSTLPLLAQESSIPVTGHAGKGLASLDEVMLGVLAEHNIPGASLAIAREGRLLLARGYGFADLARRLPVHPTSLFNLASCTKAFTGVTVLKLVDAGKLRLDEPLIEAIGGIKPPAGERITPGFREITLRQLSHHASGLPRDVGEAHVAKRLRVRQPVNLQQVASFYSARPLDYEPGTKAIYSNLGFLLLRLAVHHVTGTSYEMFTINQVLKPMGITAMHIDSPGGYSPGEVGRYVAGKRHPAGHMLRGGGCWLASSVDIMKFLTNIDGTRGKPVLSKQSTEEMLAPLTTLPKRPNGTYFGHGWDAVRSTAAGSLYHKNGGVAGISTYMEHLPKGVNWTVLMNGTRGGAASLSEAGDPSAEGAAHKGPVATIRAAIQKVTDWPEVDLFERF